MAIKKAIKKFRVDVEVSFGVGVDVDVEMGYNGDITNRGMRRRLEETAQGLVDNLRDVLENDTDCPVRALKRNVVKVSSLDKKK